MGVVALERPGGTAAPDVSTLLRGLGTTVAMGAGQVVFLRGDRDSRVFLLEAGRVRLSLDVGHGHEVSLAELAPGSLLGAISALDHESRPASAVTLVPSRLIEVAGHRFRHAVETDPRLAALMLTELSREVRRSIEQLATRCGMTTRARVAFQLLSMLQLGHAPADGRVEITQDALAEWVGATRESTARALGELRATGSIATGRGWVRVLDRLALAGSIT